MRTMFAIIAAAGLVAGCQEQAETGPATNAPDTAAVSKTDAEPLSREAALKLMHQRHEDMEKIGKATKEAGRTLKSAAPDLAIVKASAATIAGLAPKVSDWFPAGTGPDVGKTMAKPAIWEKRTDFDSKTKDFQNAAAAFESAAQSGDMDAIKARFADLGKTCKTCHDPYRTEHKKK